MLYIVENFLVGRSECVCVFWCMYFCIIMAYKYAIVLIEFKAM